MDRRTIYLLYFVKLILLQSVIFRHTLGLHRTTVKNLLFDKIIEPVITFQSLLAVSIYELHIS